MDFFTYQKFTY